jgi:hypothetical protein
LGRSKVFLTVSFAWAVFQPQVREPLLLLNVAAFILIIHGTPNILYGTLRYAWAWKHVGIVDYIQRHGSIDPRIDVLSAYHNWPGFFALGALVTEAAGLSSALSFAGWGPVFFNLIDLGALVLIFKTNTRDPRLVWLGVWLYFLTSWVGQDYFSPQAYAFFLYLVVLGIVLRWFRSTPPIYPTYRGRSLWSRFQSFVRAIITRSAPRGAIETPSRPMQRVGLILMVLLFLAVIASTHQLTPFMMITALGALVVFRYTTARNLPILMGVFTATWILYMAVAFLDGNISWIAASIGSLFSNVDKNFIDLAVASPGQAFVALMGRLLTVSVFGLAALGGLRRLVHRYLDLPFALLALSPVPMVVANSYGGEMLFRVYLFSLPFLAFFMGSVIFPSPVSGRSILTAAATVMLSITLLVGFLFAYYGKERAYYFTRNEVDATEYLTQIAPPRSLLVDVSWDVPLQFRNYEYFDYLSLESMSPQDRGPILNDPVRQIGDLVTDNKYPTAFVILTRAQEANLEMTGAIPAASVVTFEQAVENSPQFKLVYQNPDARIYEFVAPPTQGVK